MEARGNVLRPLHNATFHKRQAIVQAIEDQGHILE